VVVDIFGLGNQVITPLMAESPSFPLEEAGEPP
jgi:hypothetical protein